MSATTPLAPPSPLAVKPKPRVLILLENEPYPHDRRVCQEALALVAAGYEVTVVSPNAANAPELEEMVDGVRVLRFEVPPEGEGALSFAREYFLAGVRMRRIMKRLRAENARHKREFTAVIACNPPDFMIHLARPFARRGAGLIFDCHDPSPELFESTFKRRGLIYRVLVGLEQWAERTADVVMTVNEPCAELMRGRGKVPADRVYIVMNCPDASALYRVPPVPELRFGKEHLVLWIGRMSRKENLPLLIDVADKIVNEEGRTDIAFAIVGKGDLRAELQAEIDRRGLTDAVFLPGLADDQKLREWMSTATVCVSLDVHTPIDDRSIMVKVMEYMTMGKAVVQFPLTEMARVCGDATVYARNGDAADMAAKVRELIDDPAETERLGNAARRRLVESGLTWGQQAPVLVTAVEHAAARARSRRSGSAPEPQTLPAQAER